MKCSQCGIEFNGEDQVCPECLSSVRVLSPEEREGFDGMTITDVGSREDHQYQDFSEAGRRVYVKQIQLMPGSIIGKLLLALVVIGLLVVALPAMVLIITVALLGWLLNSLLRR